VLLAATTTHAGERHWLLIEVGILGSVLCCWWPPPPPLTQASGTGFLLWWAFWEMCCAAGGHHHHHHHHPRRRAALASYCGGDLQLWMMQWRACVCGAVRVCACLLLPSCVFARRVCVGRAQSSNPARARSLVQNGALRRLCEQQNAEVASLQQKLELVKTEYTKMQQKTVRAT
jgi:hypothetical protein